MRRTSAPNRWNSMVRMATCTCSSPTHRRSHSRVWSIVSKACLPAAPPQPRPPRGPQQALGRRVLVAVLPRRLLRRCAPGHHQTLHPEPTPVSGTLAGRLDPALKGGACASRMVKDDRYCIDILTQVSAAQAALGRVAMDLLNEHTLHCVINSDQETQQQRHKELMKTIRRLSKQG